MKLGFPFKIPADRVLKLKVAVFPQIPISLGEFAFGPAVPGGINGFGAVVALVKGDTNVAVPPHVKLKVNTVDDQLSIYK